mgnify:CR=1 FL=1|tara:strand:+ start:413551 stop:413940 length:390 start_codon:yes stop_codon:yes gene_type:complete
MHIKNLLADKAYLIAITITVAIAIVSLISLKEIPTLSFKINNSDKIGHCLAYFTLTISWFFATKNTLNTSHHKTILILLLISYGTIIEGIQGMLTTYRTADIYDILANSLGVFLGAIFFIKFNQRVNSK